MGGKYIRLKASKSFSIVLEQIIKLSDDYQTWYNDFEKLLWNISTRKEILNCIKTHFIDWKVFLKYYWSIVKDFWFSRSVKPKAPLTVQFLLTFADFDTGLPSQYRCRYCCFLQFTVRCKKLQIFFFTYNVLLRIPLQNYFLILMLQCFVSSFLFLFLFSSILAQLCS